MTADDVDLLWRLDSDPAVMQYVNGGSPTPRDEIADWVVPRSQAQFAAHGTGLWTASLRRSGEFVGWVHLRRPRHTVAAELELSYRLARAHWGRGFATEAASALIAVAFLSTDTRRIFAGTHLDHAASQAVMRRLGMRLAPSSLSLDGLSGDEVDGVVEYEILREQWSATRGRHTSSTPAGRHRLVDRTG